MVSSLDDVNHSNRRALFRVVTVTQALGHPFKDLSLSRSRPTLLRARRENRITAAEKSFTAVDSLLLHFEGKLLSDIADGQSKVDRVVIPVTGGGVERIIAVPKIDAGRPTGVAYNRRMLVCMLLMSGN